MPAYCYLKPNCYEYLKHSVCCRSQIQGRKLKHACFRINLGRFGPISLRHARNCKLASKSDCLLVKLTIPQQEHTVTIAHLYLRRECCTVFNHQITEVQLLYQKMYRLRYPNFFIAMSLILSSYQTCSFCVPLE